LLGGGYLSAARKKKWAYDSGGGAEGGKWKLIMGGIGIRGRGYLVDKGYRRKENHSLGEWQRRTEPWTKQQDGKITLVKSTTGSGTSLWRSKMEKKHI